MSDSIQRNIFDKLSDVIVAINNSGGGGATEYTLSAINDKLPSLTGNGYLGVELTGNQLALESGGTLSAIDGKLPSSLGAKTAANSFPVTLASDGVASGISNQIGEVQSSPTANTVLARLKTIGDNTAKANITLSTQNLGTANAGVIKNSSGQVFSVYAENENTAKRYLLLLNQTATPVNSQVPVKAYGIPANGAIVLDAVYFGANGLSFATGIAWAFSSTKSTVTLANATDCVMEVGYV